MARDRSPAVKNQTKEDDTGAERSRADAAEARVREIEAMLAAKVENAVTRQ